MPFKLGIDLDGCTYEFTDSLRRWLRQQGDDRPLPGAEVWDFYTGSGWEMTTQEFLQHCGDAVDAGYMFLDGEPIEGALEALQTLKDEGHSIHIVTHRNFGSKSEANTMEWLRKYNVPHDTVTFAQDKSVVDCDIFLDDYDRTILGLIEAGRHAVVFNRPWNQIIKLAEVPRVSAWDEFVDYVRKFDVSRAAAQKCISRDETRESLGLPTPLGAAEVRVTDPTTGGQKGRKLERYGLIPTEPLAEVARLYGKGAEKYAERNWELGYAWSLSYDALSRHLNQFWAGESHDSETGRHHLASVVFHAFALMEFEHTHPEKDDRPESQG